MEQEEQKTIWVPASIWRELRLISLHENVSIGEALKKHFAAQIQHLRVKLEKQSNATLGGEG